MTTRIASAVLVAMLAVSPSLTRASDRPIFDGVYLKTKAGEYVKLRRYAPSDLVQMRICDRRQATEQTVNGRSVLFVGTCMNSLGFFEVLPTNRITSLFFAPDEIDHFFIRSRSEKLNFVEQLVAPNDYFKNFSNYIMAVMWEQYYREVYQVSEYSLMGAVCGYRIDSFDVLSEQENGVEYFPIAGRINWPKSNSFENCKGGPSDIDSRGIMLKTNEGYYPIYFRLD